MRAPESIPAKTFYAALAVLPIAFLLFKLSRFAATCPYWDEWELTPFLVRSVEGTLGLSDLWVQHNEHRIVFPRMVMIALARATGWNAAYECAFSVLCVLALFAVLAAHARQAFLWPAFSLLLFSWAQMENWVWGWQLQVYMSTAAAGIGLMLLAQGGPARFAAAFGLGVVAMFSFANGMLYWFAALPAVIACSGDQRVRRAILWLLAGLALIAIYTIGYHKPGSTPEIAGAAHAPLAMVGYIVLFLGAPITGIFARLPWHGALHDPVAAWHFVPGALGLIGFGIAGWWLLQEFIGHDRQDTDRARADVFAAAMPWLGLVLYAGAGACVTAVGRAGYGLWQAMTSGYLSIGALFWCGLLGLLGVWLRQRGEAFAPRPPLIWAVRGCALLAMLGVLAAMSRANAGWEQLVRYRQMGWEAIRAGHIAPLYLHDISPLPDRLRDDFIPWLAAHGYAGLGPNAPPLRFNAADYRRASGHFIAAGLQDPALTYLETAGKLEPASPENAALRAQYQARFAAQTK